MKIKTAYIEELMKKRGENQSSLALKADVSRQTIGAMLADSNRVPGISTLSAIASALGVTVDDVIDYTEEKDPVVRNTALLRESIRNKMTELNISNAEALCKMIGYDKAETIEKLLDGKLSWFPEVLSAVLQCLDIQDPPLSKREKSLLMPPKTFDKDGAMLVRPIPVVAWANAASYITSSFSSPDCIDENWQHNSVETILIPAGNREISLAFRINGISMEPTLYDEDIILVERKMSMVEIPDKKVIVIKFGDNSIHPGVYCKRLRRFGKTVRLMSDNPAGDEFEINETNIYDIEWVGQVVKVQSDRGL